MKAIIADDSQIMRKIIRMNLQKIGIDKVFECPDGASAHKVLVANPDVAILFTDINMPGLNGYELIRGVRGIPKLKNVEIVVISEHLGNADMKTFEDLRVRGFVPKPFDIAKFNEVAVPIFEAAKTKESEPEAKTLSKMDLVSMIVNTTPAITFNKDGLTIAFEECSLSMSVEELLGASKITMN